MNSSGAQKALTFDSGQSSASTTQDESPWNKLLLKLAPFQQFLSISNRSPSLLCAIYVQLKRKAPLSLGEATTHIKHILIHFNRGEKDDLVPFSTEIPNR